MTDRTNVDTGQTDATKRLFIEDLVGKVILLGIFLWLFSDGVVKLAAIIIKPGSGLLSSIVLVAQSSSLVFLTLIVWLTLRRRPALDAAGGLEARVSAFLGTFLMMGLVVVPRGQVSEVQITIAALLITFGTMASIWCIWWLGRAFSVMATARELRTEGPYRYVRHPLYTAEAIAVIGLILLNGSALAFLVGALQFFFQYRRMINEETVLARAFPDYDAYRARTPMIIPRLFTR
jgi:protein-S-isoprenylcysteine O-methyltransferase Ste14